MLGILLEEVSDNNCRNNSKEGKSVSKRRQAKARSHSCGTAKLRVCGKEVPKEGVGLSENQTATERYPANHTGLKLNFPALPDHPAHTQPSTGKIPRLASPTPQSSLANPRFRFPPQTLSRANADIPRARPAEMCV